MHKLRLSIAGVAPVWLAACLMSGAELVAQERGLPPPFYSYPFGPPTSLVRSLKIEEAIELALAQAPAYQQVLLDEQVAAEDAKQARAALRPVFTVPLTYYGNTPAPGLAPGEPALPSYAPSNGVNKTSAFVSMGGTLDVAGGLRAAASRARQLAVAARAGSAAARRELVLATIDAYYGLSLARQKRRLADETLALAESFVELTRELTESGKAETADSPRAGAEALRRRDELEQARVGESTAADALRVLTGIDSATHISVARPAANVPPMGDIAEFPEQSLLARPQLAQVEALRLAAREQVAIARAERRPQLAYGLAGGFDATDLGNLRRYSGAAVLVNLTVPVYNFGASKSREAQARLHMQSLEAQREGTLRELRREFYAARATAFSALARIRDSQQRADDAQRSLDALLSRYRERKATMNELLDAHSAYADARTAHYQAISDYNTARVRLANDAASLSFAPAPSGTGGSAPAAGCSVGIDRAPELAGLRLGMTLPEVRAKIPTLVASAPDAFGVVSAEVTGNALPVPPADDPGLGLALVSLRFSESRLYFIRVVFSATREWDTKDEFLAVAAARFGLPGPWKAFYDWRHKTLDDAEDLRDLAAECDGFRLRLGLGFFSEGVRRVLTPHIKLEDEAVAQRIRALEAEKAKQSASATAPRG